MGESYSRKVFVGGLPPDIDEEEITASFRRFGPLVVDWPHKAESKSYFPPKGYAFLLFQVSCLSFDGLPLFLLLFVLLLFVVLFLLFLFLLVFLAVLFLLIFVVFVLLLLLLLFLFLFLFLLLLQALPFFLRRPPTFKAS